MNYDVWWLDHLSKIEHRYSRVADTELARLIATMRDESACLALFDLPLTLRVQNIQDNLPLSFSMTFITMTIQTPIITLRVKNADHSKVVYVVHTDTGLDLIKTENPPAPLDQRDFRTWKTYDQVHYYIRNRKVTV